MSQIFQIETKFNDILTEDIIENWSTNNIILNGATGSGKTYFIENNLHTYAASNFKSILFLCNRTALFHQILMEKEQLGLYNIDVLLYQTLQAKIKENEHIPKYNYIVCDEWHYVLSDAMFNKYTDLTYDWIISQEESCKIFMSGTANNIFNKLKLDNVVKEEHEYLIPYDYSYVKECKIFNQKLDVINIINDILKNTDDKIIYFANSTSFALEVLKQFEEEAVFRCSSATKNQKALKANDTECIKIYKRDLITFDKRLLITTKALDNGVNIVDRQVKHIICDVFDLESHQQCLGRKRKIDDEDTCTFYLRNYNKKAMRGFKRNLSVAYTPLNSFVNNREEFDNTYGKDREFHSDYIYNEKDLRLHNKLAYWKLSCDREDIKEMDESSYIRVLMGKLGSSIEKVTYIEELEQVTLKNEIEEYLKNHTNMQLNKDKQEELISIVGLKDSRGRLQKSISQLNAYLIENYNKFLLSKRVVNNGIKNTVWIINDIKVPVDENLELSIL
jgi:hypothetical protein